MLVESALRVVTDVVLLGQVLEVRPANQTTLGSSLEVLHDDLLADVHEEDQVARDLFGTALPEAAQVVNAPADVPAGKRTLGHLPANELLLRTLRDDGADEGVVDLRSLLLEQRDTATRTEQAARNCICNTFATNERAAKDRHAELLIEWPEKQVSEPSILDTQ